MPTKTVRILFAILALGFFAAPIALRAVGVTAEEFENRRFAQAPKLSQGWNAFQQTTQYLIDRMPLRAQAVRANTRIWTDVFNTDPRYTRDNSLANDRALPFAGTTKRDGSDLRGETGAWNTPGTARSGKESWGYHDLELEIACQEQISNAAITRRWGELVSAVRAAGHDTAMFVAPAKASIYPEYLPEEYPFEHCALPAKERFWRVLTRDGPAIGVHELYSRLLRLKTHAGDDLYQRHDTHWTTLGALALVKAVLNELGDDVRLEPQEIQYRGRVRYTGDLSILSGRSETDERVEYDIKRAPGAPQVPGRTVLVCDSFAYRWIRLFKPYFGHVEYVSWHGNSDREILDAIRRADTVIMEATETLAKSEAGKGKKAALLTQMLKRDGT